jgi:hypothetical protein
MKLAEDGSRRASVETEKTMEKVREAMGITY